MPTSLTAVCEQPGCGMGYISKIRPKTILRRRPKPGIARLEEYPLNAVEASHVFGFDRDDVGRHVNHAARAYQFFRIELMHPAGPVDKMIWRVDVRGRVNAKRDLRDVRRTSRRDRLGNGKFNAGIAFVDRRPVADGDCYVIYTAHS
jgi:hypothetical protein